MGSCCIAAFDNDRLVWFFYNNHERTFSVRDMVGEEVVAEPDGNFQ